MRTPRMQQVFAQFTDTVAGVLEDEFRGSGGVLAAYVSYPHGTRSHSQSPRRPGEGEGGVWFPERAGMDRRKQTVFAQARAHLRELDTGNLRRKEAAVEEAVKRDEEEARLAAIKRGLLERMAADGRQRNEEKAAEKEKDERRLRMPVQQEICDRVEKMMEQIGDLDRNNADLKREVRFIEKDLEQCEAAKGGRNPGARLRDMLKRWQAEPMETESGLREYARALWLTRAEFEQQLWQEARGCDMELARAKV